MRRVLVLAILAVLILNPAFIQSTSAQDGITVKLNDKQLEFDAKPYIKDGRTLVPFRKILEAFGTNVSWNAERRIVTARKGTTEIYLKIGEIYAYVNDDRVVLDVPPEITGGRTFVPLRFISENLGAEVKWDSTTRTVSLSYNSTMYSIGQAGTFNGVKFSVDSLDTSSEPGVLKIKGRISSGKNDIVIEVADDYGYVMEAEVSIGSKSGDMYIMEADVVLPGCHNFEGKFIVIKKPNAEQKPIRLAEYTIP